MKKDATILLGLAGVERCYGQLIQNLTAANIKIAAAESCTGGLFAGACTSVAGSSAWFECAVVSYSNAAKMQLLKVKKDSLVKHGAVSEAVCREMAQGAQNLAMLNGLAADLCVGVAVTGIAGPGGGSSEKPVGTVFTGLAYQQTTTVVAHQFSGGRDAIRRQSVIALFAMLEQQFCPSL